MGGAAVALGNCNIVDAFQFKKSINALKEHYGITEVDIDRVIKYLGECDPLQPAADTRVPNILIYSYDSEPFVSLRPSS